MKMGKGVVVGLTVATGLLLAGLAHGWGGGCGSGGGYGWGYQGSSHMHSTMQGYQYETPGLRNELMARYAELQNEQSRPVPDANRISILRREIVDLQNRIQDSADRYGAPAWGHMGGMMMGW